MANTRNERRKKQLTGALKLLKKAQPYCETDLKIEIDKFLENTKLWTNPKLPIIEKDGEQKQP